MDLQRELLERRKTLNMASLAAAFLALFGGGLVLLLFGLTGILEGTALIISGAVVAILVVAIPIGIQAMAWQTERIREGLASHSDHACPFCGRDASLPKSCCRWRPAGWTRSDINEYWSDRRINRTMADMQFRGDPPTPRAWILRYRSTVMTNMIILSFLLLVGTVIVYWNRPSLVIGEYGRFFAFLVLFPGILALVVHKISFTRYSRTGFCRKCGHELPPTYDGQRCTECGTALNRNSAVHVRPPKGQFWAFQLIWLALWGPMFAGFLLTLAGTSIQAFLSTGTLIEIVAEDSMDHDTWQTLASRTLSTQQKKNLLDALVSHHERGDLAYASGQALWLENELTTTTLDQADLDRIWRGMWNFNLRVPEQAVAGMPFVVRLSAEMNTYFSTTILQPRVMVDGISIDDGPFLGGEPTLHVGLKPGKILEDQVTINEPGIHQLRVRTWVIDLPPFGFRQTLARDGDGRPIRPPGSNWMHEQILETTIEIVTPGNGITTEP